MRRVHLAEGPRPVAAHVPLSHPAAAFQRRSFGSTAGARGTDRPPCARAAADGALTVNERRLTKLARMSAAEIRWRVTAAARARLDRARVRVTGSHWSRTSLLPSLAPLDELSATRDTLKARQWGAAQRALARHFTSTPQRFAIGAASKRALIAEIGRRFPDAARAAAARADRIVAGDYDLLGYRGLRFDGTPSDRAPAWSLDPVSGRRPPQVFWGDVPFLDAACGDHKIIWELNRHQHWLALGRAFWLTGGPQYRQHFIDELGSGLKANPPLIGINWASMLEVGFRSLSWLWAIHFFVQSPSEDDSPWLVDLLVGLDRQLTHVERNLSHYFSPNTHLLGEALALYVAGRALPELAASPRRARIGRALLLQEIERQISPDGGHRERSTHYHRYTLDFYSLALVVAQHTGDRDAAAGFREAVTRTAHAARLLAGDDGRVPHIGDDDGGALTPIVERDPDDLRASLAVAAVLTGHPELQIDDTPEEALWLMGPGPAVRTPQTRTQKLASSALADTGYYVSRSADGDHLVIDGGPHGYQNGGHAHADALSLTLAVRRVPLLIDPGTACYTTDPIVRDRMRSTALHNTLVLDGRSQSIPDGPFHWSHVANGSVHRWRSCPEFDYFDGGHDGYRPVDHRRRVLVLHGDLVVVSDLVAGSGIRTAAVHWHLDPRWSAKPRARAAELTRTNDGGDRVGLFVADGIVEAVSGDRETGLGWCSPAYGRIEPTTTLRVTRKGTAPFWMVSVFDLNPANPVTDVDPVPVWSEGGALAHASAVRITRAASIDHVLFVEPNATTAARETTGSVWRVGEMETDARMLFWRTSTDRSLARIALVDGSLARIAARAFEIVLPHPVPALDTDRTRDAGTETSNQEPRTNYPCAASPVS